MTLSWLWPRTVPCFVSVPMTLTGYPSILSVRPIGSMLGKSSSCTSQPMIATGEELLYSASVKYRPLLMSNRIASPMLGVCPWISTWGSLRSSYLTGRRRSPRAPTWAHLWHSRRTTSMSVSVRSRRLRAMSHSSRLVMIPYFVKMTMSGLRPMTLSLTYQFSPEITETTPTTVATPMMTPRSVRNARSLCRVSAAEETRKSSDVVMPASGRPSCPCPRLPSR
jgi:hypothetical protein